MKNFLKKLATIAILPLIIFALYFWSYKTEGSLTTAISCSSQYLQGQYDLTALKKDCPSLTKDILIKDVEDYFQNHSNSNGKTKIDVMNDIESNF